MGTSHLAQPRGIYSDVRDGRPFSFMILEYVDGDTAAVWMPGKSRRSRIDVLAKVAEALQALHDNGMAHGDVYEDNIIVTAKGRVVLIDPDAASFGSVGAGARSSMGSDQQIDLRQGLAGLVERVLPGQDIEGFRFIVDRLRISQNSNQCSAGDVARELRSALSRGSLPGETARSINDLAAWSKNDLASRRRIYSEIVAARTVAFQALLDRVETLAARLDLVVDRHDPTGAKELTIQRDVESCDQPLGNLLHRTSEVLSPDGDKMYLSLQGESRFVKPWPIEARPGILGRGLISVNDAMNPSEPETMEEIELRLDDEATTFLAVGAGRNELLTDDHLMRWLKLVRKATYSALRKPKDLQGDARSDPSTFDPSRFQPMLERAGIQIHDSPLGQIRDVVRAMMSLPKNTGLDSFGLEQYWTVPPSKRRDLVRNIGSQFVATVGRYLDAIYWFAISAPSPNSRTVALTIDLKPYDAPPVTWSFEVTMVD